MKFILGKKLNMTQIWKGDNLLAVTQVQAGPCAIVQVKEEKKDGYKAVQIGYGERKEKNIKKPQKGHLKGLNNFRYLREFRLDKDTGETSLKKGDVIDVNSFEPGDTIKVISTSKGRGFQGVVRRHGFAGQIKTHGTKDQLRMPGSIGATGPAHVFKGVRMPGRMGGDRVTVTNLEIVEVDKENNILSIKGAVPGARNGLVLVLGKGDLKIVEKKEDKKVEESTSASSSAKAMDDKKATVDKIKESDTDKEAKTEKSAKEEVVTGKEKVEIKDDNKEEKK